MWIFKLNPSSLTRRCCWLVVVVRKLEPGLEFCCSEMQRIAPWLMCMVQQQQPHQLPICWCKFVVGEKGERKPMFAQYFFMFYDFYWIKFLRRFLNFFFAEIWIKLLNEQILLKQNSKLFSDLYEFSEKKKTIVFWDLKFVWYMPQNWFLDDKKNVFD